MLLIGHVAELWRYPIKSMAGEVCDSLRIGSLGVEGDRRLAFESTAAPLGKPLLHSRERSTMLLYQAQQSSAGEVLVSTPDGGSLTAEDPALRATLQGTGVGGTLTLRRRDRPFTDVRPIALHSRATERALAQELGAFDPRRLRSNLILDLHTAGAFAEDQLSGRTLQIGDHATLHILERIPRCRIVSLHPETAEPEPTILQLLARRHEGRAGVYARTLLPGDVRLGDPVHLHDAEEL